MTNRCHKKEFLLKFNRDKYNWIKWLFEAKKRYGLSILNYMITSNHIHLMVWDNGTRETIPKSIQLIAGRVGQEYNNRKKRKGAFWEDRYHATAVAVDDHLHRCMIYVDLNMVRAGVVKHPSEWSFCGYNEIQNPPQRYTLIDYERLIHLLQMNSHEEMKYFCKGRVDEAISGLDKSRDSKWTESIAVGNEKFIEVTKNILGIKAKGRKKIENGSGYELREPPAPYNSNFISENDTLRPQNTYYWKVN